MSWTRFGGRVASDHGGTNWEQREGASAGSACSIRRVTNVADLVGYRRDEGVQLGVGLGDPLPELLTEGLVKVPAPPSRVESAIIDDGWG